MNPLHHQGGDPAHELPLHERPLPAADPTGGLTPDAGLPLGHAVTLTR